jgi:hypothetical protein
MKLSAFKKSRPTQIPIDFGTGEADTLTYDRAVITEEWNATKKTIADRLSEVLISWSITDDSGKPFQPDMNLNGERPAAWAALLKEIPPDVRLYVMNAIWDDYYAGKPLGGGSTAT